MLPVGLCVPCTAMIQRVVVFSTVLDLVGQFTVASVFVYTHKDCPAWWVYVHAVVMTLAALRCPMQWALQWFGLTWKQLKVMKKSANGDFTVSVTSPRVRTSVAA